MMALACGKRNRRGLRVARLRQRGDGADLDEAETERRQPVYAVSILVESGGEADRIGKGEPHHGARVVGRALRN